MRGIVSDYDVRSATSLDEALRLMAAEPGVYRPLAGGTDLLVVFNAGHQPYKNFLSLHNCSELKGIQVRDDEIVIGALATYSDVRFHPEMQAEFPMMCQAAKESAAIAIQNRGTIGGNIGNASPAADTPPALAAYHAEIDLISLEGVRSMPFRDFQLDYKKMDLKPNELIRSVRLKRGQGHRHDHYRKVGTRKAQAISKVCFAGSVAVIDGKISQVGIAYGSVAPIVACCRKLEDALRGKSLAEAAAMEVSTIKELSANDIKPIDDIRSTGEYRLKVALNLAADFVKNLENHQ